MGFLVLRLVINSETIENFPENQSILHSYDKTLMLQEESRRGDGRQLPRPTDLRGRDHVPSDNRSCGSLA